MLKIINIMLFALNVLKNRMSKKGLYDKLVEASEFQKIDHCKEKHKAEYNNKILIKYDIAISLLFCFPVFENSINKLIGINILSVCIRWMRHFFGKCAVILFMRLSTEFSELLAVCPGKSLLTLRYRSIAQSSV